ncbi:MAG: hypothetical protein WBD55_04025 [Dehalococcoidia bacterium]
MKVKNGQVVTMFGALLLLMGLLAFSMGSPGVALGGDPGLGTDVNSGVGAGAQPPASLPSAGASISTNDNGGTSLVFAMTLAAVGATLIGTGFVAVQRKRHTLDQ